MTPSRVPLNSLPNGSVLIAGSYAPAVGATAFVYEHNTTTQVTVYGAETGGGTLTQPLKTDANGQLPGYVLAEQDLDVVATFLGKTAGAAVIVPVRAEDLIGEDPTTKAPAIGAGVVPIATAAMGIPVAEKGVAGGVGTLDEAGRQPLSQSPLSVVTGSAETPGNLAASTSLAVSQNKDAWLYGTLTQNTTVTLTGIAAGARAKLLLTQNSAGGHTLTISDGVATAQAPINTEANASVEVDVFCPDGSTLYVSVPGVGISVTTFYTTQSIVVSDAIAVAEEDTNFIGPTFVRLAAGQAAKLVSCTHWIHTGTKVTFKLQRNGSDIAGFTGMEATTSAGATTPTAVSVADGDRIAVVVTAVEGSPKNFTAALAFENTVA